MAPSACSLIFIYKGAAFAAISSLPACYYSLCTMKESKTGSWFWQGRKERVRTHRHPQCLPTIPLLSIGLRNTNMQCLLFISYSFTVTFEQEKKFQLRDTLPHWKEVPLQLLRGFVRCSICCICLVGLLQSVFPNWKQSRELYIFLALHSYCRVSADL